jgi:hypothetical protein
MTRVLESGGHREPYGRSTVARWKRGGLSARAYCRAERVNHPMLVLGAKGTWFAALDHILDRSVFSDRVRTP